MSASVPNSPAEPASTVTAVIVEPATAAADYRSPLLSVRARTGAALTLSRLPGSEEAGVRGIALDTKPSLQQLVRTLTKASRCRYVSMKMAKSHTQFITAQLIDRALEADGCGPQVPHSANDDMVDAISHQAIFGD
ncbi:hypothetical protein [Rhodanobacter sp. TND4EL1]